MFLTSRGAAAPHLGAPCPDATTPPVAATQTSRPQTEPAKPVSAPGSPRRPVRPHTGTPSEAAMKEILDAILSTDSTPADFAGLKLPESYRAVTLHKDEEQMFSRPGQPRQGPAPVPAPRRRRPARARPGRGPGRGDGQRGELQHGVELDLRAGLHLRLPGAVRPPLAADQASRPAVPRARLRPGGRGAAHRRRLSTPGSRATRWSRTASRSSWSPRTATTTR